MPESSSPVLLLVEDDPFVGLALAQCVRDLGYAPVGPAANVAAALNLLRSERIDGAVLDVDLGGETSFPVAEALATRGIPFLFATAYPEDAAGRFPDRKVLAKPYTVDDLEQALAALCRETALKLAHAG